MKRLVLVALLVCLLLCGLANTRVPVIGEEPPPPQQATEEQESQEPQTILELLQSTPRGQEVLKYLSQEVIDEFAVTPIPPPREPQPVVYGGADAVKLTDEEAKKVAEGAPPQEKPPYFREGYVINTPEGDIICTGILDLREIDKMDAGAIEDVRNYLSKFDPSADLDGDGYMSNSECIAWVENYLDESGLP